jgi:FkbM family methyltransferase
VFGARSWRQLARGALRVETWRSLAAIPIVTPKPLGFARRYLFDGGEYPIECPLRTPTGLVRPTVFTHHDMLTVHEIFCRLDYPLPSGCRVVVDIGSNIGLSGLYFLTRDSAVRVHLFEPDPRNVECLRANLAPFEGRWTVHEQAVADRSGREWFGRDVWSVGRYGAIGLPTEDQIEVQCRHVNDVLREVLEREDQIDFIKIDTEGLENATLAAMDRELLAEVRGVCFETTVPFNPWPERFAMTTSHMPGICRLSRR